MSTETAHAHEEHNSMTRGKIVRVFVILLVITVIEFIVALAIAPHYPNATWINPIYIVLTLLKAYFIVAFFMHLKFEKLALILTLVLPILFIIGLILVLTNESHYWIDLRM